MHLNYVLASNGKEDSYDDENNDTNCTVNKTRHDCCGMNDKDPYSDNEDDPLLGLSPKPNTTTCTILQLSRMTNNRQSSNQRKQGIENIDCSNNGEDGSKSNGLRIATMEVRIVMIIEKQQ
jgi:hypothetical protein